MQLPEIEMIQTVLSRAESCRKKCIEILEGPMNLKVCLMFLFQFFSIHTCSAYRHTHTHRYI